MGRNLLNSSTSLTQTGPITRPFGTGTVRFFTSTTTWTVPPGITTVRARVWGGGANGNRTTGKSTTVSSGGGGGFAMRVITGLTPGSTVTITVPAISTTPGAAGGTCSFGAFVSATGGSNGSTGGSGSNGDINFTGGSGNTFSSGGGGGGVANLFGNGGNGAGGDNLINNNGASGGGGSTINSTGVSGTNGGSSLFAQGGLAAGAANSPGAASNSIHSGYAPTTGNEQRSLDLIGVGGGGGGGNLYSTSRYRGQNGVNGGGGGSYNGTGGFPGGGAGSPMTDSQASIGAPGLVVVEW